MSSDLSARTRQQELNLLREMNRIIPNHLKVFAYLAAVTVRRGRVYRFAQEIGVSPLEITTELGRDLRHLKRVGDLADTYGQPNTTEYRHAAWLAFSCYGLRMETVVAGIESDEAMLKILGPTGRFARALAGWRRLVATGAPPPVESVACQIGHFYGVDVDEYSVTGIVLDLVDAFPPGCVTRDELWTVVADHRGALVLPELCRSIAEDAVGIAIRLGSKTPPAAVRRQPSNTGWRTGSRMRPQPRS